MNRKVWIPAALMAILSLLVASLNLTAAPILSGRRRGAALHDSMRSLKNIRQVRLNITPIAATVTEAGLTVPIITRQWTERLKSNGFEIVEDTEAPLLRLFINEIGDPAIPNAKGYVMTLHVIQNVKLARVDLSVNVPTFVYMIAGLEPQEKLPDSVRSSATNMIDVFIRAVQKATRAD